MTKSDPPFTNERFDAVLFDLDGVITDTARLHAACWKRMFDEFLEARSRETGELLPPFEISTDYVQHVDGKPRYDGVRDFLTSRGIHLPEGTSDSAPAEESIRGLGNRKNELINELIASDGVDAYESSVALIRELREQGFHIAVVSSSGNCRAILEAVGISDLFDARVDGVVAAERGLPGKPAPDTFLEAARELGVDPRRAVVVEDAISGVQAGRAGNFGLVIGVARKDNAAELRSHGADIVVNDLGELRSQGPAPK